MRVFSYNTKTDQREKWKITNLDHFMEAKTSMDQICPKYVPITDFGWFVSLLEAKNGVKMSRNLEIFAVFCRQAS